MASPRTARGAVETNSEQVGPSSGAFTSTSNCAASSSTPVSPTNRARYTGSTPRTAQTDQSHQDIRCTSFVSSPRGASGARHDANHPRPNSGPFRFQASRSAPSTGAAIQEGRTTRSATSTPRRATNMRDRRRSSPVLGRGTPSVAMETTQRSPHTSGPVNFHAGQHQASRSAMETRRRSRRLQDQAHPHSHSTPNNSTSPVLHRNSSCTMYTCPLCTNQDDSFSGEAQELAAHQRSVHPGQGQDLLNRLGQILRRKHGRPAYEACSKCLDLYTNKNRHESNCDRDARNPRATCTQHDSGAPADAQQAPVPGRATLSLSGYKIDHSRANTIPAPSMEPR